MANNKAKAPKSSCILFLSITLILSVIGLLSIEKVVHSDQGASHQGELLIESGTISADLKEVPIRKILEQIREQANVWYESDESLLREKISIQFKDLPLEKGMRRILASFDHALEFNARGELVGLTLLGESGSDHDTTLNRDGSILRVPSRNTLGVESGTTTRVVDLPRPLPVKVIDRKGIAEASLEQRGGPADAEYEKTEPEVKIHVISPRNVSSHSELLIPRPAPRNGALESSTPESGIARGVPLDALE